MSPLILRLCKKTKNVINSKTYFFLIENNEQNIIITKENVLEERKSVLLI